MVFGSVFGRVLPISQRQSTFLISTTNVRTMAQNISLSMKTPTELKIPVPWGEIRGLCWGKPTGIPVLAVHGWLDNAGSFSNLFPLLSDDLNIVAVDLPGHGQSSHRPPGCRYNFVEYLTDIKRVVDVLEWKQFMLIGHSLGAAVCTWFAAALPDMVKGFVAIEGFGVYTRPVKDLPELMGKALLEMGEPIDKKIYPTWEAAVDRLKEGHIYDPDITVEAAEILCKRGTIKVEGGYKFSRDLRLKQHSLLYASDDVNNVMLQKISCPTVLIIAENTFLQPEFINKRLKAIGKPIIKLVRIERGGHHLHLYNPESIADLVDHFLHSQIVPPDYQVLSQL